MPKQHTVPAVYLADFSDNRRSRARESMLWVGRRGILRIFRKKAEHIGAVPHQYTLNNQIWMAEKWDPLDIDAMWTRVERGLSAAVDSIVHDSESHMDAKTWLYILAEFAAQIFVRGSDFRGRYLRRVPFAPQIKFDVGRDDYINAARVFELHRLRGATRRANWTILHAQNACFITNDCCRTPFHENDRMGYVVPLRKDAALELSFSSSTHVSMTIRPGPTDTWVVGPIHHVILDEKRVGRLNEMLAAAAIKEIYGSPERLVNELHEKMALGSPPWEIVEPTLLAPFRDMGDSREFMALVAQVASKPSEYRQLNNDNSQA